MVETKTNVVVPTTPAKIPLPAEYVKLGLMTGYNPCPIEETRLYITGLPGEGKSTFVNSIPDSWVIDYEKGVGGVVGRRTGYFNIYEAAKKLGKTAYEVHREILDNLIADGKAGKRPCVRVIFDTHDGWTDLEAAHLLNEKSSATKTYEDIGEYGQKGHGHSLLQGRMKKILTDLEDVGYAWAVVGHLTYMVEHDVDGKDLTVIRPLLSKGYHGPIVRKAELHLTINSLTKKERPDVKLGSGKTVKGKEEVVTRYYLYTKPTERRAMEGKQRGVPNLKAVLEIPLVGGWDVLKKAYNEAVDTAKKTNGN
jgi:hypothetical protein